MSKYILSVLIKRILLYFWCTGNVILKWKIYSCHFKGLYWCQFICYVSAGQRSPPCTLRAGPTVLAVPHLPCLRDILIYTSLPLYGNQAKSLFYAEK